TPSSCSFFIYSSLSIVSSILSPFRFYLYCLACLLFFFFMLRRPPRSTLFPSRRSSDLVGVPRSGTQPRLRYRGDVNEGEAELGRSEEHTSELQSRFDLVCRLLLEKKKNKYYHNI